MKCIKLLYHFWLKQEIVIDVEQQNDQGPLKSMWISTYDDRFGHETATVWGDVDLQSPRSAKSQLRALYGPRTVGGAMGDWTDAENAVNIKMFQLTSPDDVGVVSLVDLKHRGGSITTTSTTKRRHTSRYCNAAAVSAFSCTEWYVLAGSIVC